MFQKMLSAAEKQAFDVVVFWKLDRFSRSLMHAVQLESKLREHDVRLYSVTEQIDTTSATGRFNFRNIASAAEFERDMIKQRTEMVFYELASDYCWPNGSPPLGYNLDSNNRLVIANEDAELVVEIFRMYVEQRSMPDVAQTLNDEGISTSSGGMWTPRAVGDILSNPIYKGRYEFADISEHVSEYQIVDTDLFEEVKSIRHRFQSGNASKSSMSDPRKDKAIKRMREMYREFRAANSDRYNS
jgi:site-specific DNA recombinase